MYNEVVDKSAFILFRTMNTTCSRGYIVCCCVRPYNYFTYTDTVHNKGSVRKWQSLPDFQCDQVTLVMCWKLRFIIISIKKNANFK